MTMRHVDFLLVGAGLASVTAARTLRMEDPAASIAILSGEAVLPYQRPPLTKGFLDGSVSALQIAIRPAEFYAEQRIDLMLGARAVRVDAKDHVVHLADGSAMGYGKLLIATGVSPRAPALPGMGLAGVYSLHTLADASAVRDAALQSAQSGRTRRAVVIGAGFVGIETAASLRALGLDVTVIERQHAVMPQLRAPVLSAYFAKRCVEHGVAVKTDCLVESVVGREGGEGVEAVEGVVTNTGETIACDLVVAAVGVAPNCAFLEGSGVALADGVVVDDCLQSSDPDIYAAGDVASFFDPVFGVRRRIEHWDNARRQGNIAARNMRGGRFPYRDVSMFFGDAFGQPYNFMGFPHGVTETVERGSLEAGSYSLLYLKHDVLRAIFSLGRTAGETSAAEELIRLRISLHGAKPRLADTMFPLDRLPEQTVLILQGGGALGAFECGAIRALEEKGVRPDVISAVSIGAFNAAIVASHPGDASRALAAFWRDVSIPLPALPSLPAPFACGDDSLHDALLSWYVLWFGVPNFLRPRWWNPNLGLAAWLPWWTSLYDTSPVRTLIERYVDFDALAASPTRLLLSAVDVATGEPRIFDSYVDRIGPEHLLASGSLPPGMPWTMVDGRAYWDGGIVSNSPLDLVIERCGRIGGRIFAVDLFSGTRAMPSNLLEVMLRRDEIVYTDRVRNDLRFEEYANDFSDLVDEILKQVDEPTARRIRQRPHFIRLMGNRTPIRIARIALDGGPLSLSSDFDFSASTVTRLQTRGYEAALAVLARDEVPVPAD